MGSFMLGACGDFLEEESQSEVIPKTTSDFSELLLGTGYPDESAPNFSFLSLMDDDCAHFDLFKSVESGGNCGNGKCYHPIPDLFMATDSC